MIIMKNPSYYEAIREFIRCTYASPAFIPDLAYRVIDSVIFANYANDKISRTEGEELESLSKKYYRNYTGESSYPV